MDAAASRGGDGAQMRAVSLPLKLSKFRDSDAFFDLFCNLKDFEF